MGTGSTASGVAGSDDGDVQGETEAAHGCGKVRVDRVSTTWSQMRYASGAG
ncbi:hypothetical protein ACFHWS_23855 [Micromonospora sp. LOL_013]|uniref:hypothetical protein n=1 Tax=Micromonospora sp. LOL_013 TaxID=3345414 RepID=UPI003A88D5CB